eukprot:gb/GECG01006376.1/.p1 GENE.gb/GECG01006376.1/~~gb/GECG01006376.1/.p1  ORF type:complete len:404 (+),score=42.40 gb/GECG01006376.1/:1-1212(+)
MGKGTQFQTCLAASAAAATGGLWLGWGISNQRMFPEQWLMEELKMPPQQIDALRSMKYGCPNIDGLRKHGRIVVSFDTSRRNPRWVYEHFGGNLEFDSSSSIRSTDTFLKKLWHFLEGSSPQSSYNESSGASTASRSNSKFYEDTSFEPDFRNRLEDFRGSGYDRGHQAAAANHTENQQSMDATFVLSNMSPQIGAGFNRNYWKRLEMFVRGLKQDFDEIHVFTGPLYLPTPYYSETSSDDKRRGSRNQQLLQQRRQQEYFKPTHRHPNTESDAQTNQEILVPKWELRHGYVGQSPNLVAVPTHFFKVILAEKQGTSEMAVAAFVIPNQPINARTALSQFAVEITDVEKVIGMRLFPHLVQHRQHISNEVLDLRSNRPRTMFELCSKRQCDLPQDIVSRSELS